MKRRLIIVHGWGGSPANDWIGWAAEAFREKGYEVIAPEMPDTDNPVIEKWVRHLSAVTGMVDKNTYFIGHSIGCQTIMRFLETIDIKIGGAIFVAGWFNLTNQSEEEDVIAKPWIQTQIDYAKVKTNLIRSVTVLSDDDPYVPYEETKKDFEAQLGSEVVTVSGAGHFTISDGFGPFQQLVEIFEKHFGIV
ncbi:MAG: alpha/beta hydrolase [Patescibacteria group bacterium]|mgnify:FL=1